MAERDGDLLGPPGGSGDEPMYFFQVRVSKKIAWNRGDCAFMSISFIWRIEVP